MKSECRVVPIAIFAKEPVPGRAKTRLMPSLGAAGAASLHAQMVEHAVVTAIGADLGPVHLWVTGSPASHFFRKLQDRYGITLYLQGSGNLGERMLRVFAQTHAPLLLMGSDCPVISSELLRNCARELESHTAVFLPAEDGGYGLIGLQSHYPRLFDDIAWGTEMVMEQTRRKLRCLDMIWREVEVIWDLDRPADLKRLEQNTALCNRLKAYSL